MVNLLYLFYYVSILAIIWLFVFGRSKYKNRSGAGAFFFENDCLVLNTGVPYPIPFNEIERVELHYRQRELDRQWSYGLWVLVVKKSGKTMKVE